MVSGFVVRTLTLWCFVTAVLGGLTRRAAWLRETDGALSLSSGYRLWRRVKLAQSALRTRLCREAPLPASPAREPVAQLVAHLGVVLGAGVADVASDLFAAFQTCLGQGLFDLC